MLSEIFLIITHIHTTALQEKPKLPPSLVFEMVHLLKLLVKVQHARGKIFFPKAFNIFQMKLKLIIDNTLIEVSCVESL
jgi:hypothetical protein